MKKENIRPTVVLSVICVAVALLLAVVNVVTKPIIDKAANDKANATLTIVLPEGESFEEIDLSTVELPASVTKAYKETNGKGYVFEMSVSGYKSGLVIMCGVDAEGKITGSKYTASSETFGKENKQPFGRIPSVLHEEELEGPGNPYAAVFQNFADHICGGIPLFTTGWDGFRQVQLANAVYVSGWCEKKVRVPVKDAEFVDGLVIRQEMEHNRLK